LDWWQLRGGYTLLKKDLSVKSTSADLNKANAESDDPTNQALIQSTMKVLTNGSIGTVLRYTGSLPKPEVSEYVALDMRLAWNVKSKMEVSVVGQNILQHYHTEFAQSNRVPKDIERSIYIKVACRF
jgi:iron complex outermembrane receptor protein